MFAISPTASGVAFFIHVTPRARRPGVGGCQADALRVRVGVDGDPERLTEQLARLASSGASA